MDFGVQLGSVTESVTVADSVSLIQGETSAEGRVIERQTISALPLATRNFTQLLGLTAGVVTDPPNAEQIGSAPRIQASTVRAAAATITCSTETSITTP